MSLVGIGTPPTPLPQASVPPPPEPKGGGHTRRRVGAGGAPIPTTALCLLCGQYTEDSNVVETDPEVFGTPGSGSVICVRIRSFHH
jgi:hypothetical protein